MKNAYTNISKLIKNDGRHGICKKAWRMMGTFSLFTAVLFMGASLTSHASPPRMLPHTTDPARTLFVQTGSYAKINNVESRGKPATITLFEVYSHVVDFTDRPVKKHGKLSNKKFANLWHSGFKQTPPNVAIETSYKTIQGDVKEMTLIGALSHPHYNPKAHTMRYTLHLEKNQDISHYNLGRTTLFFDDIPFNPGGF